MRSRLPVLTAAVTLAFASLATPVAAGGARTFRVDDDGLASATSCAGTATAPATIQAGVDASGPGDTIIVCPGRYPEQVTVTGADHAGLTIRAVRRGAAVVAPTSVSTVAGYTPAMVVGSDGVTVQWLRIGARTTGTCQWISGILVSGATDVHLQSNRITPIGDGPTQYGSCGLRFGIIVTDSSARARVLHNLVLDYDNSGIAVLGSADATVARNSVRYWHTTITGAKRSGPTCSASVAGITPAAGITFDDSTGRIRRNAVNGPEGANRWGQGPFIAISVESSDRILVADNAIARAANGIHLQSVTGGTIARNTVTGIGNLDFCDPSGPAVSLMGSGAVVVRDNVSAAMVTGFAATETAGATFTGNVATDSYDQDCQDATGADLGSIDNTWTDNVGAKSQPAGLCTASAS